MLENIFEIFLMFYPSLHSCPLSQVPPTPGVPPLADVIYK